MNSIQPSNGPIRRVARFLRVTAFMVFAALLATPLVIASVATIRGDLLESLTILVFFVAFSVILSLRNERQYSSILECFYWDKITLGSFLLMFLGILVFHELRLHAKDEVEKSIVVNLSERAKIKIDKIEQETRILLEKKK